MRLIRGTIDMNHRTGLHARPAVKLTRLARTFPARIRLRDYPHGAWVDAKSIVNVMGMKLPGGRTLEFEVSGDDADAVLQALTGLVARGFDEKQ